MLTEHRANGSGPGDDRLGLVREESPVQSFLIWLEGQVPSVHASLAPPATTKSLKQLASKWSVVPEDFLELYRAHDGQVGEDVDFVPSHCLMSIADILQWQRNFMELEDELSDDERVWDAAWIPFAQLPVYLEFLALHSETGEVVAYDHKGSDRAVIARSFAELLTQIRIAVRKKHFVVTKRGLEEHPKHSGWTGVWARACEPKTAKKSRKRPQKRPRKRSQKPSNQRKRRSR